MMTMNQKYNDDPAFRRMVDYMTAMIVDCKFTPSEMREAAMCASINYEMMYARPTMAFKTGEVDPSVINALEVLRRQREL